jgi:hypothetical protein
MVTASVSVEMQTSWGRTWLRAKRKQKKKKSQDGKESREVVAPLRRRMC